MLIQFSMIGPVYFDLPLFHQIKVRSFCWNLVTGRGAWVP